MLDLLWNLCVVTGDWLLGWLLRLPADVALIGVALLTALLFTLVRKWTTDQDRLRRANADQKRVKELLREAKARKDAEAVARLRQTGAMLGLIKLKAEMLPLVVSLIPIALLATWAAARLEFCPPAATEWVQLEANAPATAVGQVAHLVPEDGLETKDGWVKALHEEKADGQAFAVARWTVRGAARPEPYALAFRLRGASYAHALIAGQPVYAPAIVDHGGEVRSQVLMRPRKLFGVVPGLSETFFPAWLTAYVIVVVPAVFLFRWLLKVE